ncbi:hypothetical protein G7072_00675 [Nocardioides sp. HDW12B]|uniref:hypothetical protein n=1 Tax=Nocardioides sp. HDW12B TaxID=2714939 RepID=UPI00140CDE62|nr:hypothetical protein [Nocardioides sp. HDW12B]QIK65045.1 hypothetical protein G7072_00675 [Nocardioides sp. HDW12B]
MEWLLMALAVGGGGTYGWTKWRAGAADRAEQAADLEVVRRLADEDVTVLGEQLSRLDTRLAGAPLDDDARVDYQAALDAYERAGRAVPLLKSAAEVSTVIDTLSHGRHAMACVEARVAGEPPPPWRPPCFFDPRHGMSVTNVMWTPPGRGTRTVPACAQDAARVAQHEKPEVRSVVLGGRRVPYWQAGSAILPYTQGYFTGAAGMAWAYEVAARDVMLPTSLGYFGVGGGGFGDGGGGGDAGGGDGGGGGF